MAYPELRLVVTMRGDTISYAESLDEALQGLFSDAAAPGVAPRDLREAGRRANAAFRRYLEAQGDGRSDDAAAALRELEGLLSRLARDAGRDQPQGD